MSSPVPAKGKEKANLPSDNARTADTADSKGKIYDPEVFVQFKEGDPYFGKFVGRLLFHSEEYNGEKPPQPTSRKIEENAFNMTFDEMVKARVEGSENGGGTASSLEQADRPLSDINVRMSAVRKLITWRTKATSLEATKRRGSWDIILEMGSPVGSMSTPNRWADDIKALRPTLSNKNLGMIGSQIEIKLDLTPHSYIAEGRFENYIQEIRTLRDSFPENIRVVIDDASVGAIDPSVYYPAQDLVGPFYSMVDRMGLRSLPEIETKEHRRLRLQIGLLRWAGMSLDEVYETASAQENERAMKERATNPASELARFNTKNIIAIKGREVDKIFANWKDVTVNFVNEEIAARKKRFDDCKKFLQDFMFD
ncbi:hypothetical protein DM02DRAFT_652201 [Periconia macrospinosa]|uniref:Uncharacterized protein n=1 Tax=Periconia macrospinosa TaxID=97972 RepID=A0A2V1E0W4_9PLEO|nr:hypothetical protein DM02DRAFT_652201 [Periconia macrospinosa]